MTTETMEQIVAALRAGKKEVVISEGCITRTFSFIKGVDARNWDGSLCGWKPAEPQGQQEVLQMCSVNAQTQKAYYQNWW